MPDYPELLKEFLAYWDYRVLVGEVSRISSVEVGTLECFAYWLKNKQNNNDKATVARV